jgi:basic amino acid/polyamine antiporter, APA family
VSSSRVRKSEKQDAVTHDSQLGVTAIILVATSTRIVMHRALERVLGLRELILIVIGTVIGSGIFIVPATVLQQTGGDIGPALLVWLLAGIVSLLGALTYGELGAMNPDAGGLYVYIRDAFGSLPAFLYGWTLFFVISSGSVATLAVASTGYLSQLVPLSPLTSKLAALAMVAIIAIVNVMGTSKSATVQDWSTLIKTAAIIALSLVMLVLGRGLSQVSGHVWPASIQPSLLSGIGLAMVGVLWAYEGWQYVTFSAGETRDPQRTFPRGIVIGTALLIAIYMLANVAYIAALGPAAAAQSPRIAADAVGVTLGPAAAKLIAATIVLSMFSAANGLTLTAPRAYYAMARDGVFFRRLAAVHPRFGTPAFAVIASSVWAMLLAATGTFTKLLTYVVFTGWIFYALGALSIFSYRRRSPAATRPFRVPGYPVTPILFVLASGAIVVNTLLTQPGIALRGLIVVAVGVPAFYAWQAQRRSRPTASGDTAA